MGLTKRALFDNDPAHDGIRQHWAEERDRLFAEFTVRLPTRRKNRLLGGGRWDSLWPGSLAKAANELNIDHIGINDGMFFRTVEERERTARRGEELWRELVTRLKLAER